MYINLLVHCPSESPISYQKEDFAKRTRLTPANSMVWAFWSFQKSVIFGEIAALRPVSWALDVSPWHRHCATLCTSLESASGYGLNEIDQVSAGVFENRGDDWADVFWCAAEDDA